MWVDSVLEMMDLQPLENDLVGPLVSSLFVQEVLISLLL